MPFGFYDRGLLCVSETDRSPMGEIWAYLLEKGLANVGFFFYQMGLSKSLRAAKIVKVERKAKL